MEEKTKEYVYLGTIFVIHLLYVLVFFGVFYINPVYIADLSSTVQILVSVFLIWKFHPYREWMSLKEPKLTHFDRVIIYSSATFLLINVALTATFTVFFIKNVKTSVPNVLQGYLSNGNGGHYDPFMPSSVDSLTNIV
jgi:hypothetical protein